MFEDASHDHIVKTYCGYDGDSETAKQKLIEAFQSAARRCTQAKNRYGNGISIKGMVICCAGSAYLVPVGHYRQSGKDWDDNETLRIKSNIPPCGAKPFFHAKRDSTMCGTRGAIVLRAEGIDNAYNNHFTIAWENPYAGKSAVWIGLGGSCDLFQRVCFNAGVGTCCRV